MNLKANFSINTKEIPNSRKSGIFSKENIPIISIFSRLSPSEADLTKFWEWLFEKLIVFAKNLDSRESQVW